MFLQLIQVMPVNASSFAKYIILINILDGWAAVIKPEGLTAASHHLPVIP